MGSAGFGWQGFTSITSITVSRLAFTSSCLFAPRPLCAAVRRNSEPARAGTGAVEVPVLSALDAPAGGSGWDPYREMFRVAGDYTFNQLSVQRVTARTKSLQQSKVVNVMIAADFRVEGRARRYYPDGADAILFGMLKDAVHPAATIGQCWAMRGVPVRVRARTFSPLSDSCGSNDTTHDKRASPF